MNILINKWQYAIQIQMLVFATISSGQSTTPKERKNAKSKLRLCPEDSEAILLATTGTVEIPTFYFSEPVDYLMVEYELDKDLKVCDKDSQLVPLPRKTMSMLDFDKILKSLNDSENDVLILRSATFLLENGYLSVGDETKTSLENYAPGEFCLAGINRTGLEAIAEFRTCLFSPKRPLLRKCCPVGTVVHDGRCRSFSPQKKWSPVFMDAKTENILPIQAENPVHTISLVLPCKNHEEMLPMDGCNFEFHPTTDNNLAYIGERRNWEFFDVAKQWCMDLLVIETVETNILVYCEDKPNIIAHGNEIRISYLYVVAMYIGAFFHFLTTLVYLITWSKQNLPGKALCSCTASLSCMQIFRGTALLFGLGILSNTGLCLAISVGGHYFMLSSFTWILVINVDLWRTFRSIRREVRTKSRHFLCYSVIGWGFPLIITITSIILNFSFPCRTSRVPTPQYGEYYCFVAPPAQLIYVYYILGILISMSFVFAGLTMASMCNFKETGVDLRSNQPDRDKQNVLLFLKMGVLMGLNWGFEFISWAVTPENSIPVIWIIFDMYNALSGILTFIIFCKVSIYFSDTKKYLLK